VLDRRCRGFARGRDGPIFDVGSFPTRITTTNVLAMISADIPPATAGAVRAPHDRFKEASHRRLTAGRHTNDAVVDLEYTRRGLCDLFGARPHTSAARHSGKRNPVVGDRYSNSQWRRGDADVLNKS
jgi:hypothetical protein